MCDKTTNRILYTYELSINVFYFPIECLINVQELTNKLEKSTWYRLTT